ncbi:MAG: heme-binding protein [Verrucomicrobiota bacterium]
MKSLVIPLLLFSAACSAEPGVKPAPAYVSEAPLPEGWPQPGPYNKVVEKKYPAYRAAFTEGSGSTIPFFTLFAHIKKNDIPMTAPVELSMEPKDGALEQISMAFLYQNEKVGKTGPDGTKVEVRDIPGFKALVYAWQGTDSKENIARAREALEAELMKTKKVAKKFRMSGYNGPDTPRELRTWELQAVID